MFKRVHLRYFLELPSIVVGMIADEVLAVSVGTLEGDHGPLVAHDCARIVVVEVDALPYLGRGSESNLGDALLIEGIILPAFGARGPLELLVLRVWRAHELLLLRESRRHSETPRLRQLAMGVLRALPIVEAAVTVAVG